jgi:type IV pilus assembly protein PilM
MEFIPRTMGTRPRLACEVSAEGVVAARAEDAFAVLSAVARVPLTDEIVVPRLTAVDAEEQATSTGVGGDVAGRAAVVAAVRKALEAVALRDREVTLVVPDASVRVLLLEFDELPAKAIEALPVVRFRLKKLLPFDADDAAISYQVMSSSKALLRVLAVAMPRELLADYESVVREAGFEPGAILPSTLAALASVDESDAPQLIVNAGREGVTTAIVKAGIVLLHRTVDLGADQRADKKANQAAAIKLPVVDCERTAEEWARQEPLTLAEQNAAIVGTERSAQVADTDENTDEDATENFSEVAQAISVAAAYFEDTLESTPTSIYAAGTLGARVLTALLAEAGVGPISVREIVSSEKLGPGAATAGTQGGVPLGWLAGVRGALAN